MIRVESLAYEYPGKRALDNVSFAIKEGSITALVGPNGAGKTTLLRCIAALDEPFSGAIEVAGINVAQEPRRVHREIGYLSDFFGLYNDLTVAQCLTFMARIHTMHEEEVKLHVEWAAKLLELTPYLGQKAGTLSRGWRQRVGIAQAIIHRPRILLLDEPASGLDPEARATLSGLFHSLRDQGMTLVVSSHILAELEDYCTDMLVLRGGQVVEHRSSASIAEERCWVHIHLLEAAEPFAARLRDMQHVGELVVENRVIRVDFRGDERERHALLLALVEAKMPVSEFTVRKTRMQDVYMSLAKEGSSQ